MKRLLESLDPADQVELHAFLAQVTGAPAAPAPTQEVARVGARGATVTFRREFVRCGKEGCRCREGEGHGPYVYKYWREKGRLRKRYVGRG